MEETSHADMVVIGENFAPHKEEKFDILNGQTESNAPETSRDNNDSAVIAIKRVIEQRKSEESQGPQSVAAETKTNPEIEPKVISQTSNAEIGTSMAIEKSGWRTPKGVIDYLDTLIRANDIEPQVKTKLKVLLYDIDKDNFNIVRDAINTTKVLTAEQRANLLNLLGVETPAEAEPISTAAPTNASAKYPQMQNQESSESRLESDMTEEQLRENLKTARNVYIARLIEHMSAVSGQKTGFRMMMTELGQPERQMPEIAPSPEFLAAAQSYEQARKALFNKLKQTDGMTYDAILTEFENEGRLIDSRLAESLPSREAGILRKFLEKWKVTLPSRAAASNAIVNVAASALGADPFSLRASIDHGQRVAESLVRGKPVDSIRRKVMPEPVAEVPHVPEVPTGQSAETGEEATLVNAVEAPVVSTSDSPTSAPSAEIPPAFVPEKNASPEDMIAGRAPISAQFQFDKQYRGQRNEYNVAFEKALIDLPEGEITNRLAIEYDGGRIYVLQKGDGLTLLLNGEKIGEGTISANGINLKYNDALGRNRLMKNGFETAFDKAQEVVSQKALMFASAMKMAA